MVKHIPLLSLLLAGSFIQTEETRFDQWTNWTKKTLKNMTETTLNYSKKGIEPIKTAAIFWAGLSLCRTTSKHLCSLLRRIAPKKLCIDAIDPDASKNSVICCAKIIPWAIAGTCLIGYTTETVKKKISKEKAASVKDKC